MTSEVKYWWESKIIWAQIIAAVFAVLKLVNWLPTDLDQADVVAAVMLIVTVATAILRLGKTADVAVTKEGKAKLQSFWP